MSKVSRNGASAPRSSAKSPVSSAAVARVQVAVGTQHGGGVPKGSYVGRLQHAAAKAPK